MKIFKHITSGNYHLFLVVILISISIYFCISLSINKSLLANSWAPYYNFLVESFTQGRLDVITNYGYDLTSFRGKLYLYWGPAPTLFILPFYILQGKNLSDIFYTLVAGCLNIFLFYLFIKQAIQYFKFRISKFGLIFIILSFAFISPNIYLSLGGRIWHTSQIIATFYLLIFYYCYFKYLNSSKRYFLLLAIIFFNLAWLSRFSLIINIIFFLNPYFYLKNKLAKFNSITVGLITVFFVSLFFLYNFFRFGEIFETGISYQNANARFIQQLHSGKQFSIDNFFYNFNYYFLNFPLEKNFPFMKVDPEGLSVLFVYPTIWISLFSIIFLFHARKKLKDVKFTYLVVSLTIFLNLVFLLSYVGTGWTQFGNRYFFDLIPLLFIVALFVLNKFPKIILLFFLIFGILINVYGAYYFFSHF